MQALSPHLRNSSEDNIPLHIAIIMDGNGRWAKSRGLPRIMGHRKGVEALKGVLEGCQHEGIKYLTIYAFSAENWKRPAIEINDLMELLRHYLNKELQTLHEKGVRIRIIGDRSKLAPDIIKNITDAETLTQQNTALNLTVALSYGARQEIAASMATLFNRVQQGLLDINALSEKDITHELYTHDLPDLDLLIRTGGEQRLSNFLLWQAAYAELYFTPVLWPDFTHAHLKEAISEFTLRERRYGNTGQ